MTTRRLEDKIAESHEDELTRLDGLDVRMVKELTLGAEDLTREQVYRRAVHRQPSTGGTLL